MSMKKEEERMEAEKEWALTMSSSWAPLSERESESSSIVTKSGREEVENDAEAYRDLQGESFMEKARAREDDAELSKEKSRLKKQKLSSPPLLSLSLPDTSLHLASSEPGGHLAKSKSKPSGPAPKASEIERSFRSFGPTPSQSNGSSGSLSLSLSHQFFHNPSCSITQTSVDVKEGTTCSGSSQISLVRDESTEGSRGSSFGGREHFFHMASEGLQDRSKHGRELPLYLQLLQSGNGQLLQGAPANGEGTRDSSRSFMDERSMELLGNPLRDTEGSHGGNSLGGSGSDGRMRQALQAAALKDVELHTTDLGLSIGVPVRGIGRMVGLLPHRVDMFDIDSSININCPAESEDQIQMPVGH